MLPSIFVSHGSPMIALEPGAAGAFMQRLGPAISATFGKPKAIVSISAHTAARVPVVLAGARHSAVYDFGGFDPKLFTLRYDAPGDPALAARVLALLRAADIAAESVDQGGLDHGAWTALRYLYPAADIPIVPLAFVPSDSPAKQFALGAALASLAQDGVLVLGSGSITHNLRLVFSGGDLHPDKAQPEIPESAAFRGWIAERARALALIADEIEARAEDFARLTALDTGNALRTQARPEVATLVALFRYFSGIAGEVKGTTLPAGNNQLQYTRLEPLGVVACILPWNSPLMIAGFKVPAALAAGNTVILKAADDAPLTILLLAEVCNRHLPAGVVNALTGRGSLIGSALATHRGVDKVSFTGSTEVGLGVGRQAGERLAQGLPFSLELDDVLTFGTAVGGARPKALLVDGVQQLIAKFSVSTDTFPWMQAEAVGMELARRCGVHVAPTELTTAVGRDVLLVERFDRPGSEARRLVLSALTLLGLHELAARHGTYVQLAELVRLHFDAPNTTLHELFRRIVVNVLVGNTDDHARNHAAFWDGNHLSLTPAFDICPQPRSTGEVTQAMAFGNEDERRARLAACVSAAAIYDLSERDASGIVDECTAVVREQYEDVCATVGVGDYAKDLLWGRAVANDSVFYSLN